MSKVLGESGRYVSEQAAKEFRSMVTIVFVTLCLLSVIGGFFIGWALRGGKSPVLFTCLTAILVALAACALWSWANSRLDQLERKRLAMRRGASGESIVALLLAGLPDEFCVIHDVTTPFGNLDHVVVDRQGPLHLRRPTRALHH